MKINLLLPTVASTSLALFFILAGPTAGFAKGGGGGGGSGGGSKTPPAQPSTKKVIESVSEATNSIVIKDMQAGTSQDYTLTAASTIMVNDVPGKFASLKTGMQVTTYVEGDAHTLDSISVTGKGGKGGKKKKS